MIELKIKNTSTVNEIIASVLAGHNTRIVTSARKITKRSLSTNTGRAANSEISSKMWELTVSVDDPAAPRSRVGVGLRSFFEFRSVRQERESSCISVTI